MLLIPRDMLEMCARQLQRSLPPKRDVKLLSSWATSGSEKKVHCSSWLYWGYIGVILGIMAKKMETTIMGSMGTCQNYGPFLGLSTASAGGHSTALCHHARRRPARTKQIVSGKVKTRAFHSIPIVCQRFVEFPMSWSSV